MKVANCYQERENSKFIIDLLKLDVDGLLSVHAQPDDRQAVTDFENKLQDFIRESGLKNTLIRQTPEILVNYIL